MKIVCDACQAKYSIADEKIQGKAFKIRCKKCNHIIVVRVGADGAASGASAADRPRTTGSHAAASSAAAADKARPSGPGRPCLLQRLNKRFGMSWWMASRWGR